MTGGTSGAVRRVYASQLIGSTTDGMVLATAVLYFATDVGLGEAAVGAVLAVAAGCALLASVPVGLLAARIGLRRTGVALSAVSAAALAGYAVADGLPAYAAGAICFAVGQAGTTVVRQAVVATRTAPEQRVRARGTLHTLLNAGMGLGTAGGTVLLAVHSTAGYVGSYLVGAVTVLGCAALFAGLPADRDAVAAAVRRPGTVALRDRPFVQVTALFAVVQLTMPVLSVLLPLWVVPRTGAPAWAAGAALALNTVLVVAFQTPWAARVRDAASATRSGVVAAAALLAACLLIGLAGVDGGASAALVLAGAALLTVGEIGAGAMTWWVAFERVPEPVQAQYQGVFGMAASLARIVGPTAGIALVTGAGPVGWAVLGTAMAAACLAVALRARRAGATGSTAPGSTVSESTVPGSTVTGSTVPASTVPGSTVSGNTVPASTTSGVGTAGSTTAWGAPAGAAVAEPTGGVRR